jgi:hypothetical protein
MNTVAVPPPGGSSGGAMTITMRVGAACGVGTGSGDVGCSMSWQATSNTPRAAASRRRSIIASLYG